jgi:hypothetical protein
MSQLHLVKNSLYDQSQAIVPATQMINKLDQYLHNAISKPAYLCAMILDPMFKTEF